MQNPYFKNRKLVTLEAREPSLTDGSHKKLCDIHNIINQYDKTGLLNHINQNTPQEIDHTQLPTFQEALNLTTQINQQFDQLPNNIKKRFKNKEGLHDFISNPKNYPEAEKLGLIQPIIQPNQSASEAATHSASDTSKQTA